MLAGNPFTLRPESSQNRSVGADRPSSSRASNSRAQRGIESSKAEKKDK
jgi:hypothetical protein